MGKRHLARTAGISKPTWGRWAWGFIDQGFSSVSNFGLTLLAARLLGPGGLGVVAIGFALYLVALSFQRSLISQPLVISSSTLAPRERSEATASSVTATLMLALAVALVLAGFGALLGGAVGHGLVLILGMVLSLPLAWSLHTTWAVIGCWGLGAGLGAALGLVQARATLAGPIAAWDWWKRDAWPMGRWLAGEGTIYMIISQTTLFVLVALLGTAAIGGYRAAATIFAPLTLLRPAIALPGLPAMTRAVSSSRRKGRRVAGQLSGGLVAFTTIYVLLLSTRRMQLLALVFGASFGRFAGLILPIGIEEIFNAFAVGFYLFLKGSRQGRSILWSTAIAETSTLVGATALALRYGLLGAAWGMTASAGLECIFVLYFSLRGSTRGASSEDTGVALNHLNT